MIEINPVQRSSLLFPTLYQCYQDKSTKVIPSFFWPVHIITICTYDRLTVEWENWRSFNLAICYATVICMHVLAIIGGVLNLKIKTFLLYGMVGY